MALTRRSFIRNVVLGLGAIYAATTTGLDFVAKKAGFKKRNPFPVWDVKWKLAGTSGWKHLSTMNLPEGQQPPKMYKRSGVDYQLFKFNAVTQEAFYFRPYAGPAYYEPDGKSPLCCIQRQEAYDNMFMGENSMLPGPEIYMPPPPRLTN